MSASWVTAQSIVGTSPGRPIGDFYPTPAYVTEALLEKEIFPEPILEPACGDGAIVRVLDVAGYNHVVASDLYDRGFGMSGVDFLSNYYTDLSGGSVITNPPFSLLESFIEKCIELKVEKFALLAKLSALEGMRRSSLLDRTPLCTVYVFRKRITMTRNGEPSRNGGMIAFAWYVWERDYIGRPMIGWI